MKVKTNRQWRQFVYRSDVPSEVLASQFDWQRPESIEQGDYQDGFLCYRGHWYHLADFLRLTDDSLSVEGWQGYSADGFYSGVVIRVSSDGERYQIGTYTS